MAGFMFEPGLGLSLGDFGGDPIMLTTFYLVFGVSLAVSLYHAVKAFKSTRSLSGFFLHDRRLTLGPFIATMVGTNISLGNFILLCAGWGYLFGYWGFVLVLVGIGCMVFSFLRYGPSLKAYIEDPRKSGTLHQFLADSTTSGLVSTASVRVVASLTTTIGLLLALALELLS